MPAVAVIQLARAAGAGRVGLRLGSVGRYGRRRATKADKTVLPLVGQARPKRMAASRTAGG